MTIPTARRFAQVFYHQLLQHGRVDLAGNQARSTVLTAGLPGAAIPVLFMRLPAGQLFETVVPLSPLHDQYLRSLFGEDCDWAKVSMSLFDPQEKRLARKVSLLDIFTPLPVDFAITLEITESGEIKDWWCGNPREEPSKDAEREWFELAWNERSAGAPPEEVRGERKLRQRSWVDLAVGEADIQPLLIWLANGLLGRNAAGRGMKPDCGGRLMPAMPLGPVALCPDRRPWQRKEHLSAPPGALLGGSIVARCGPERPPAAAGLNALPGWTQAYTPVYIELRTLVNSFAPLPDSSDQTPRFPGWRNCAATSKDICR